MLMMPSFGSSEGGAYVVPWKAIPEMMKMSIHDRALHEEVAQTQATTPELMRVSALKVGRTGLAGPAAAEAARRAIEADKQKVMETHFLLIMGLLSSLGLSAKDLVALNPSSESWRATTKSLLSKAGGSMGIEVNEIYVRIGALSQLLAPIGLGTSSPGRLRTLTDRLPDFRDSIAEWAETDTTDLASFADFASSTADSTFSSAVKMLTALDNSLRDVGLIVREWQKQAKTVAHIATRMSWLLDGWDFIFAYWDQAVNAPIEEQREAIVQLLRVLPLIPRNEAEWGGDELSQSYQKLQGRNLPANIDWRTGRQDLDMIARIEAAKAKVVFG